ncbi:DUF948 domain-containing protein [Loigolactobacillus coryniformis]|uniref:DUF948 domain-containing protein n=1 Tax=Loigolactobacillus coryniformis TaxID=1610 RepID=A0A5B8TFK4_9LACO|nr:DUF948 domain-containing protein [Loigolactobacillus coryniformis]QEA53443.1 DUF948 domain-containing protein [Loigolactobacillus coryniformis]RRG05457.1 MAG: DUF948 domain-containing protein [Lactobacillus sp.]
MTGGEIAGLIAAIAFLILVIGLVILLRRVTKVMKEIQATVNEATRTVTVVTGDVDTLSKEVEGLLTKANVLLDDVNGKVANLDPVFQAAGDLGASVSDLNEASHNLVDKISNVGATTAKASALSRVGASALRLYRKRRQHKATTDSEVNTQQGSDL